MYDLGLRYVQLSCCALGVAAERREFDTSVRSVASPSVSNFETKFRQMLLESGCFKEQLLKPLETRAFIKFS